MQAISLCGGELLDNGKCKGMDEMKQETEPASGALVAEPVGLRRAFDAALASLDGRDADTLRAALRREMIERRRAECLAKIQTDVVKFAVDLLVREPDIDGFFRALLKTLAEEGESHEVGVWLIDEDQKGCDVWMVHLDGQVFTADSPEWKTTEFPRQTFARHLFSYEPGWHQTVEYSTDDERMPASVRDFIRQEGLSATLVAPLVISDKNLGWITLCTRETRDCNEDSGGASP